MKVIQASLNNLNLLFDNTLLKKQNPNIYVTIQQGLVGKLSVSVAGDLRSHPGWGLTRSY